VIGRYGKGLHRPDPAKLARRMHASLHPVLGAGGTPRGSATLTPCPRLKQKDSTCHAHSASGAIWTAGQKNFIPSPLLIASTTYADVQGPADHRGALQDTGADLSDDATALATWGIAPMQAEIADGTDEPLVPDGGAYPEPDITQLAIAGEDLVDGEYQIPVDAAAPKLCALALDAGIPIWLGFLVDDAFENLGPNDIAQPPIEPGLGGHAVYLSAYRTAADGSYEFLLQNSWGDGWALNGSVWVSTAWLLKCWMLWPMAVKK
jgi:hypothetical protein